MTMKHPSGRPHVGALCGTRGCGLIDHRPQLGVICGDTQADGRAVVDQLADFSVATGPPPTRGTPGLDATNIG